MDIGRNNEMKYTPQNIITGIIITLGMMIGGLAFAQPAHAELKCSILPSSVCGNAESKTGNGVMELLKWVLRILTGGVGIAAVGAFIFAGVLYSSASGDTAQVSKAKTMITNTVIGIIAYALIFLVLNWLIPGGVLG